MKNLSKSEKALLIIMITCSILFVYYRYFLSPVINDIRSAKDDIITLQDQKANISVLKLTNKSMEKQIDTLKAKVQEAAKTIPQTERNPEITYDLKKLGDPNKVFIKAVDVLGAKEYTDKKQDETKKDESKKDDTKVNSSTNSIEKTTQNTGKLMFYPVMITVSGDYNSIMNYVKAIEGYSRIADIASLNITKDKAPLTTVTAKILLSYYYIDLDTSDELKYEFNKGPNGKTSLF